MLSDGAIRGKGAVMRGSTVLVVLVILGLSLGACSKAVEETVEEAIERQEGVSDVEIDEEGGTLEFSIEDEEGEARVSVGAGELPDGFPRTSPWDLLADSRTHRGGL